MKLGTVVVDGNLDLAQLQRRIREGEGLIGPLKEIGKEGSDSKLVFDGTQDHPDFKAMAVTSKNDPHKDDPNNYKLVAKGNCFLKNKDAEVLVYRFYI